MATGESLDWVALAAFIELRRHELGLTVTEAAEAAGVSTKWWYQIEAAQRRLKSGELGPPNARGEYLGRAARALKVPLVELRKILEGADDVD